jgi:ribonuclease D
MSRRELAVLRAVAAWRETEARHRDLPRNFVLPKEALPHLARRKPRTAAELQAIKGLRPEDGKRHGRTLLRLVGEALALPPAELPAKLDRPLDLTPWRAEVHSFRRTLAERADELGIPPELLVNRKTAENLMRRALTGAEPLLPADLTEWRRKLIGPVLDACRPPSQPRSSRQASKRGG